MAASLPRFTILFKSHSLSSFHRELSPLHYITVLFLGNTLYSCHSIRFTKMALVLNASFSFLPLMNSSSLLLRSSSFPSTSASFFRLSTESSLHPLSATTRKSRYSYSFFSNKNDYTAVDENEVGEATDRPRETLLYSFTPLPLLFIATLPGAATVRSLFEPFVELVKSWNLPDWLVHWGHPGNMAVVLFAMGGYGTYLGFHIRFSDDAEEKAKAIDLHPKLLGGMFFFFALGATGGITSLLTSDKPIFESPHAVTGIIGLSLLTIQTILPALFEGNPGLRNVHGILGSGIMTLFLIHAVL